MMARSGKNIIGARVKEARLKVRPLLTQDGLSGQIAAVGVHLDRAAISKIESGSRYVLDYELKAIAEALGVSVAWLLDCAD